MLDKKSYIVIGVGKFGASVIKTLAHTDIEVLVIDKNTARLEAVSEYVTDAICANASDADVLNSIGVKNFDGVLVTFDHDFEDKVLITMLLKEMGASYVMVKASSELEGRVLKKVGADKVVHPERDMGIHIGNQIAHGNLLDSIELNESHSIADFAPLEKWIGKSIKEIGVRSKYNVSIIGIRDRDDLIINPTPEQVIKEGDTVILLGENRVLDSLMSEKRIY